MTNEDDNLVDESCACPSCRNRDVDTLVWDEDGEVVTCQKCGSKYQPEPPLPTKQDQFDAYGIGAT